jgi:hypothetical protein
MLKKTSVEHLERGPEMASTTCARSAMAAKADGSLATMTLERAHTGMQLARWPFMATVVLLSLPIMHWAHTTPDAVNAPTSHSFLDLLDASFNGPTTVELAAKERDWRQRCGDQYGLGEGVGEAVEAGENRRERWSRGRRCHEGVKEERKEKQ